MKTLDHQFITMENKTIKTQPCTIITKYFYYCPLCYALFFSYSILTCLSNDDLLCKSFGTGPI